MAHLDAGTHAEQVHNGPSTQTTRSAACCGSRVQVVALTRDEAPGSLVELVRCSDCDQSVWCLDGLEVAKGVALAALSAAFTSTAPRAPRPMRVRPEAPAPVTVAPAPELSALLSGWQVLGTTR
jgi:hypothetical protein